MVQLLLLTLAVTAAAYTGSAVTALQEAMRAALHLTDNEIALLQGPVLAVPMTLAALPLGFLIDRYSRVRLLIVLTALDLAGSLFTALATDFTSLCAARCLVGLTAFAVNPVAFALSADLYPPHQRGRANMVMVVGQSGGAAAVFALGGTLLTASGSSENAWRWAMLGLCVPLVASVIAVFCLREPDRTRQVPADPSTRATWRELARHRKLIAPLLLGVVMAQIALGAEYIWAGPMLSRTFALPADRVGAIMGTGLLIGGALGSIVGGVLADACEKSGGPRRTMTVLCSLTALSLPTSVFAFVPGALSASSLLIASITLVTGISVMGLTLVAIVVPNELRGLCMAVAMAVCVLIGNGLAPMLVSIGAAALGGEGAIGEALSLSCLLAGGIGVVAFASGRWSFPRKAPV